MGDSNYDCFVAWLRLRPAILLLSIAPGRAPGISADLGEHQLTDLISRVVGLSSILYLSVGLLISLTAISSSGQSTPLTAQEIIDQSAQATYQDWEKVPGFDFCELDRDSHRTKTYQVLMIGGSSHNRLVALNGEELSPEMQQQEAEKLQERQSKTVEEQRKEAIQYDKERQRDQHMLEEFTDAMDYTLSGTDMVDGHSAYVVDATPPFQLRPEESRGQSIFRNARPVVDRSDILSLGQSTS